VRQTDDSFPALVPSPEDSAKDARWGKRSAILLAGLIVIAWFGSLELRGLFIPDEGRYGEIPCEMLVSGDWVTPRLNDLKYF
jgi:4-amino-4-deoxy-L-arabinose transferase-like glycosyltransferase